MKVHSAKLSEKTQQVLVPLTLAYGNYMSQMLTRLSVSMPGNLNVHSRMYLDTLQTNVRAGIIPPLMYICRSRG